MTESEFRKIAKDFGYDDEIINDLVEFSKENGISFDEIAIEEHIVD